MQERTPAVLAVIGFLTVALTASPLMAYTVSGRVTNPNGQGVYPVNIDVNDSQTGDPIPVFGDTTTTQGYYSISLAAGTYDFLFIPEPGMGLAPHVEVGVTVGSNMVLDAAVPWGYEVSGRVTSSQGNAVVGLDIDVRDSFTKVILPTPSDNTGPQGYYMVTVPEGTFDFIYTPNLNDNLPTHTVWEVYIHADTTIDVTLPQPAVLSGRVRNQNGAGIPNVDLDVDDALTGRRIRTQSDNTDSNGDYSIVVPRGFLHVLYEPPMGSGYADDAIWNLVVNHDLDFDVTLSGGWQVSGYVVDPNGVGVPNVDLDLDVSSTGARIHTSHDNTDATGYYEIMVPSDTYDIYFEPPEGAPLVGKLLESQTVNGNRIINRSLEAGFFVSGTVTAQGGEPVASCDLDVTDAGSGQIVFTPRDNTDAQGYYSIVVPAGTFDFLYEPPVESGAGEASLQDVPVNDDMVQNIALPNTHNQAIALSPEGASIFPGDVLKESITVFNNALQARRIQVSVAAILPNGNALPVLDPFPPNGLNLAAGGTRQGNLSIPVPQGAPADLRVTLKGFILDYQEGDTLGVDSTMVVVLDPNNPARVVSPHNEGGEPLP